MGEQPNPWSILKLQGVNSPTSGPYPSNNTEPTSINSRERNGKFLKPLIITNSSFIKNAAILK
ncbi:hypothetical protein LguiA_019521 [Lonicera macranthoides]